MTTETGQALLGAILDSPGDDAVRLVYADWLEETGQAERAEFVRVQVELAGLAGHAHPPPKGPHGQTVPACRKCDRQLDLEERERGLFTWRNINLWDGRSPAWQRTTLDAAEFRKFAYDVGIALFSRGFVSAVKLPQDAWLEHGPAVALAHPVERVELGDKEPWHDPLTGRWLWFVWGEDYNVERDGLKPELFDLLMGSLVEEGLAVSCATREAAENDASRACLLCARRKAARKRRRKGARRGADV